MNKLFYPKLALTNLKNNKKAYIPYILTCIATVLMFYNMYAISTNSALKSMSGGDALKFILGLGNIVIGLFAVIFLTYTNQFLIKRRKKEFGLFNILGMEKKHISRVMFYETLYVGGISFIVGILGGLIFNKLVYLGLAKILKFNVRFGFFVSIDGIVVTAMLFGGIFLLTFLNNLRQIHLANPVELLKGDKVGEREPKIKWLLLVLGILSLSGGYYISLTVKHPVEAMLFFFVAVILVIIGTYCLFTTGSIAILKLLRKNKNFYYKTKNFISVSGMIHRMKQNAVGLANICILSTMVLVMLSTTVSLYIGVEDIMKERFPRNIEVNIVNATKEKHEDAELYIEQVIENNNATVENISSYIYMDFIGTPTENKININQNYIQETNNIDLYSYYTMLSLDDYNRLLSDNITLNENEILLITDNKYHYNSIIFGNFGLRNNKDGVNPQSMEKEYTILEGGNEDILQKLNFPFSYNNYLLVMKDGEAMNGLSKFFTQVNQKESGNGEITLQPRGVYAFDVMDGDDMELTLYEQLSNDKAKTNGISYVDSLQNSYESFLALYGGLFFLGIFLGLLFMIATILIIYYKQISEGFEDRERFQIMKKVGLSHSEVKKTISSQVLIVFFLPLVTAIIHIIFAFPVISKLLMLLNLSNMMLFVICTIVTSVIFAIIYGIVYVLTAREYYKIVV